MRTRTTPIRRPAPSQGTPADWNAKIIAVRAEIAALDAELREYPDSVSALGRRAVLTARLAQLRAQRDYTTGRGVAC